MQPRTRWPNWRIFALVLLTSAASALGGLIGAVHLVCAAWRFDTLGRATLVALTYVPFLLVAVPWLLPTVAAIAGLVTIFMCRGRRADISVSATAFLCYPALGAFLGYWGVLMGLLISGRTGPCDL